MSGKPTTSKMTTLCRQRYADIVMALHARFNIALAPDAQFQFTQPIDPLGEQTRSEQQAWLLAVVKFGRHDDPLAFAKRVGAPDAAESPSVEGGYIRMPLAIPEGVFVVKILSTQGD